MCAPFKVRCILPAKDSESVQCFELFHNVSRSIRLFSFFSAFMKCSCETLPSAFFSNWLKKLWKRHIFTIRIQEIASLIHYKTENHSQSPQIVFIKWKPLPLWWFPHRSSARNVRRVLWSPVSPEGGERIVGVQILRPVAHYWDYHEKIGTIVEQIIDGHQHVKVVTSSKSMLPLPSVS